MAKQFLILVLVVAVAAFATAHQHERRLAEFEEWARQHHKHYTTAEEHAARLAIFTAKADRIEAHNKRMGITYKQGLNEFSDLTREEFASTYLMQKPIAGLPTPPVPGKLGKASSPLAPIDWNEMGYVTPVKNQGQCGSCWTFSSTGAIESATAIHYNQTPVELSEQQLLDCSHNGYNNGCQGGAYDLAFQYVIDVGGIEGEDAYPYTAVEGTCLSKFIAQLSSYQKLPSYVEKDLQNAVYTVGPVSVAIDASQESFSDYTSGVYYEANCTWTNLIHEVLVVGLGHDDVSGMDYYIVKNSWGTTWGMQGYIWMAANQKNNCGIASYPVYPIV